MRGKERALRALVSLLLALSLVGGCWAAEEPPVDSEAPGAAVEAVSEEPAVLREEDFVEQPSDWAAAEVNDAIQMYGITHRLRRNYTSWITREDFCALLVDVYETFRAPTPLRAGFVDTQSEDVQKLAALGIVNGVGNNRFAPDRTISRQEVAALLCRMTAFMGKYMPPGEAVFADETSISDWARESVGQVQAAGVMKGDDQGNFRPWDALTREESIILMYRMWWVLR